MIRWLIREVVVTAARYLVIWPIMRLTSIWFRRKIDRLKRGWRRWREELHRQAAQGYGTDQP